MNDTTPEMEARFRALLMARSGAERLKMGFAMFDSARALVLASLAHIPEPERKKQLFLRTYGNDFDRDTAARIIRQLPREPARPTD